MARSMADVPQTTAISVYSDGGQMSSSIKDSGRVFQLNSMHIMMKQFWQQKYRDKIDR